MKKPGEQSTSLHEMLQDMASEYVCVCKAVNREDKRSRRYRDRHFAKFERSRRYRDRYRC